MHCEAGVTRENPWSPEETALLSLAAIGSLAEGALQRPLTELEVNWLDRLVAEANLATTVAREGTVGTQAQ